MNRTASFLLLAASILLSLGGIASFVVLFVREFNVYWLILSPVIFAVYQIPAVSVYWIWKRRKTSISQEEPSEDGPPSTDLLQQVKQKGGDVSQEDSPRDFGS